MIKYVKGDLLESSAQALVNTVNTVGVMGKGIALQFKEAFPNNFNIYRKICKEKKFNIGDLLITKEQNLFGNEKILINFPTKTHWKLPSEYSYIEIGLQKLKDEIIQRDIKSIAIPPLGSHNGGLDWRKVKSLIEKYLNDINCRVYIYEPSAEIIQRMHSERVRLTPARAMLITLLAEMTKQGEFPSPFAAEKIVYFLQKFGAKKYFKIDFFPYLYGPYSKGKITHVLYHLNGSYIKGMVGMDNRPFDFIWLTEDAEKEAKCFLECFNDKETWEICDKTSKFLKNFYSSLTLEILATTDYILNNTPELKDWKNINENELVGILDTEIGKMSSRKKELFHKEYIKTILSHLKSSNP